MTSERPSAGYDDVRDSRRDYRDDDQHSPHGPNNGRRKRQSFWSELFDFD